MEYLCQRAPHPRETSGRLSASVLKAIIFVFLKGNSKLRASLAFCRAPWIIGSEAKSAANISFMVWNHREIAFSQLAIYFLRESPEKRWTSCSADFHVQLLFPSLSFGLESEEATKNVLLLVLWSLSKFYWFLPSSFSLRPIIVKVIWVLMTFSYTQKAKEREKGSAASRPVPRGNWKVRESQR